MKKLSFLIFALTALLISSCTEKKYSPTHEDIEAIGNKAVEARLFKTTSSFILIDSGFSIQPQLERIRLRFPADSLKRYGFTDLHIKDPTVIKWKEYKIDKATIISRKDALANSKKSIIYFENKESDPYSISCPIFSEDGKYALIAIQTFFKGSIYLCRHEGNDWVIEKSLSNWMM